MNPDKPRLLCMVKMPTMKDKGRTLKSAWKLNNSNATKKRVHQAISHTSNTKGKEGSGSKASGKEGQCCGSRRLEDQLQKMGGGSQAPEANTKPIASVSTNVNIVNNVHNELNVWYTNSDQFLNKIDELKLRIYNADTKP